MIDTSKAVRPCVEELANTRNTNLSLQRLQIPDTFYYHKIKDSFKTGTFTGRGLTFTNMENGVFAITEGNSSGGSVTLTQNFIPMDVDKMLPCFGVTQGISVFCTAPFFACASSLNAPSNLSYLLFISYELTLDGGVVKSGTSFHNFAMNGVPSLWVHAINNVPSTRPATDYVLTKLEVGIGIQIPTSLVVNEPIYFYATPFSLGCDILGIDDTKWYYDNVRRLSDISLVSTYNPRIYQDVDTAHFMDALASKFDDFSIMPCDGGPLNLYQFS